MFTTETEQFRDIMDKVHKLRTLSTGLYNSPYTPLLKVAICLFLLQQTKCGCWQQKQSWLKSNGQPSESHDLPPLWTDFEDCIKTRFKTRRKLVAYQQLQPLKMQGSDLDLYIADSTANHEVRHNPMDIGVIMMFQEGLQPFAS